MHLAEIASGLALARSGPPVRRGRVEDETRRREVIRLSAALSARARRRESRGCETHRERPDASRPGTMDLITRGVGASKMAGN